MAAAKTTSLRIPVCAPLLTGKESEYLRKCIESSWISSVGPFVTEFERKFSGYCGTKHGVTTNSGTTALHLALASLRIGKGDEVILPTFTMIACINAVEYTGAKAVLVDSDEQTWSMDVSQVESKLTPRTKAVMPVHIYGHPVDMDSLLEIAERRPIDIVEDAAEAIGATYRGKKVGSIGRVGCFSFYSNKIITTGEGGMNVTSDAELAERMAWLRAHAFGRGGKHFWHEELGFGYRMSALQAAVGLAQFERIDEMVRRRISHARLYNELLKDVKELTLPVEKRWARNVYWMYSVRSESRAQRDGLMAFLAKRGIETRTFFYPLHKQPYYAKRYRNQKYPVAEKIADTGMNLPSGNGLTEDEVTEVCDQIRLFYKRSR